MAPNPTQEPATESKPLASLWARIGLCGDLYITVPITPPITALEIYKIKVKVKVATVGKPRPLITKRGWQ